MSPPSPSDSDRSSVHPGEARIPLENSSYSSYSSSKSGDPVLPSVVDIIKQEAIAYCRERHLVDPEGTLITELRQLGPLAQRYRTACSKGVQIYYFRSRTSIVRHKLTRSIAEQFRPYAVALRIIYERAAERTTTHIALPALPPIPTDEQYSEWDKPVPGEGLSP